MEFLNDHKVWAYTLLRISMGINIFIHGAVRIPKLDEFSSWMQGLYQNTILPGFSVQIFAHGIPLIEAMVGLLLILGLFTNKTLLGGAGLMVMLIAGSCLIEKWDWAGIQMIYALFYFGLSYLIELNKISIDQWRLP